MTTSISSDFLARCSTAPRACARTGRCYSGAWSALGAFRRARTLKRRRGTSPAFSAIPTTRHASSRCASSWRGRHGSTRRCHASAARSACVALVAPDRFAARAADRRSSARLSPANAELAARIVWPLGLRRAASVMARAPQDPGRAHGGAAHRASTRGNCISRHHSVLPGRIDHHNVLIRRGDRRAAARRELRGSPGGLARRRLLGLGAAVGYEALPLRSVASASAGAHRRHCAIAAQSTRRAPHWPSPRTLRLRFVLTIAPDALVRLRIATRSRPISCVLAAFRAPALASRCARPALAVATLGADRRCTARSGLAIYGVVEPECLGGPVRRRSPRAAAGLARQVVGNTGHLLARGASCRSAALPSSILAGRPRGGPQLVRTESPRRPRSSAAASRRHSGLSLLADEAHALRGLPRRAAARHPIRGRLSGKPVPQPPRVARSRLPRPRAPQHGGLLLADDSSAPRRHTSKEIAKPRPAASTGACRAPRGAAAGSRRHRVDLGPFIAALTQHRVLSAPYHRLDKAILETHAHLHAHARRGRGASCSRRRRLRRHLRRTLARRKPRAVPPADALKTCCFVRASRRIFSSRCRCATTPLEVWRVKVAEARSILGLERPLHQRPIASSTASRPSRCRCTASQIGISMPFSARERRTAPPV